MPPGLWTRNLNFILACLLMFLAGSQEATGIFNHAVEQAAFVPGYLDNVWSSSMAFASLVAMFSTSFSGAFLDGGIQSYPFEYLPLGKSKTHRIRILSAFSTLCFAALALGGWGITQNNIPALRLAVAIQGASIGIYYIITLELLASWVPENTGFAVGCGQIAFGIGPGVFGPVFNSLIRQLGASNALYVTAAVLSLVTLLCTFFIEWPPPLSTSVIRSESDPLLSQGVKIPWQKLVLIPSFWIYMFIAATSQVGFAFYPYFFTIGLTYGRPMELLVRIFQIAVVLGTLARFVAGVVSNEIGGGPGLFQSGPKNMMLFILALQTSIFAVLPSISRYDNFIGFVIASVLAFCLFGAGSCTTVLLAREMFSAANSALVLGLGAGVMMCLGEFSSSGILYAASAGVAADERIPSSFNLFYIVAAMWSLSAFLLCMSMRRCEEAFGNKNAAPLVVSSIGALQKSEACDIFKRRVEDI